MPVGALGFPKDHGSFHLALSAWEDSNCNDTGVKGQGGDGVLTRTGLVGKGVGTLLLDAKWLCTCKRHKGAHMPCTPFRTLSDKAIMMRVHRAEGW